MRTVLLLDFDNIYLGLNALDPAAARRWAEKPDVWLRGLRTGFLAGQERRFLQLRCYMNPGAFAGDPPDRVYFSRFRPYFIAAGFEVVDCPPLTKRGKNAADIRMVIDALDDLSASTHYDEFVIASADADFTPLLQRLRAHDRRTTLVTSGDAVTALGAVADVYVDDQQLLGLLDPVPQEREAPSSAEATLNGTGLLERFRAGVSQALAASAKPVNMSTLSSSLQRSLAIDVQQDGWPGGPAFANAIRALQLPGVEISGHLVYDTARHDPPATDVGAPSVMDSVSQVLGFPRLPRESWPVVFEVLAEYAATQEFSLSESTKWTRDRLAERETRIGRQALGYIVKGAVMGGADLRDKPSAREIGEAVLVGSVLSRAEDVGLDLGEDEVAEIRSWLGVDGLPGDESAASSP